MIKTALAFLMALSVSTAFADTVSPMQLAQATADQWDNYWNAKDSAGIASIFTPDGVLNFPEGPADGQEAIHEEYAKRFKAMDSTQKVRVTKVNPGDTLQWAIGDSDLDVNKDGKTIHLKVHWGATYEVQGSVARISTLTFNIVPPPQPAAK